MTVDEQRALLAVALLAFLAAFVTWSVQVRTDQAALAAATWGGALLLSESRVRAAFAGVLLAASLLCTQKAIYVIGLGGILLLTASWARAWPLAAGGRKVEMKSLAARIAWAAATAVAVIGLYVQIFPQTAHLASGDAVASGLEVMRWTRERQGYRIYTVHADRLLVHWSLFAMLVVWSVRTVVRKQASEVPLVATCWLVLLLGVVVIRFHGSSFPYFIMSAGLFPAIALALTAGRTLATTGRMAWHVLVAMIALAALQSVTEALEMLPDTQTEQRDTLRLIHESNLSNRRGYQIEGALFCAMDPSPIPPMFSQDIARHFHISAQSAKNAADFIAEFRNRPIAYIVESFRLQRLPKTIRRFLGEHYVWYGKSLYLAGFRIEFASAGSRVVDVIVPATYRWTPDPTAASASIIVNERTLSAFEEIELQVGKHTVEATVIPTVGSLILADLPARERQGYPAFYHQRQYLQLRGLR